MAITVWRSPDGHDYFNVERDGTVYPFSGRGSAELVDALPQDVLVVFDAWSGGMPPGFTDVTAEALGTPLAPTAE